ncbi:dihydrofolate reductase [Seongchinamella sediminis]|uniref:Dihydrofolate reductase n=1 Tax=Seongchinamella sediminis TaxID=2283635 RepID=A0A3L7E3M3_9GAMM|nr:dihydrofolate reductase [Seongchinamella sediminis]RLQ23460.1 dihydrofolate reductase [Seongchinamella sediminis]
MKLAVIVAAAENGVIGRNNALPWHLPEDLRYFKRVTMGKPIVMGRKTFESIGRPLPGRTNIVITRQAHWHAEGVRVAHSLDEALAMAGDIAISDGATELMVIGGAEIYRAALPRADRLYFTEVHGEVEGDALLPDIDWSAWTELSRERFGASGANPYPYSFLVFERQ